MNEVWAGTPLNVAAKLSSVAGQNQVVMSERAFDEYLRGPRLRRRALLRSCGCDGPVRGRGLDMPLGEAKDLWNKERAPGRLNRSQGEMRRVMR